MLLGRSIPLFKLFGFQIKLDPSWFVIAFLITWSLAAQFPLLAPGLATSTYWLMAIFGALGLFTSILLHEIGHSVVARGYGLQIRGITLFIFGGVAELEGEPKSPKEEFWVAIAGPLVSVAIAVVAYGLGLFGAQAGLPTPAAAVLLYLGLINGILVAFNLIPAFPLDGGRVLRSALWKLRGNLRWATRITSILGSAFGLLFIAFGIFSVFTGNLIGGLWMALIGWFLRNAASMSYQQLLLRQALEGEPVHRFMTSDVVTVPPTLPVRQLADEYLYRHYHKLYPVVENERLVGCITVDAVKELPREQWETRTVGEIATHCSANNTIEPDADAINALSKMSRNNNSRLMVTEGERLVGIIALKDLMRFFSMKVELEDGAGTSAPTPTTRRPDDRYERAPIER